MKVIHFLAWLSLSVLLSACAVIRGRQATSLKEDKRCWRATIKPPSAIFRKPNKQTPTTYTVRSYGRGVLSFWAEPNTSPGTMRKRARLWKKHFPSTGATMSHGYTLALRCIV